MRVRTTTLRIGGKMSKRQVLIFMLVVAFAMTTLSPALAGGMNGTYVQFTQQSGSGIVTCDTYWKTTRSGLVHEWRNDTDCAFQSNDGLHLVFKPTSKFSSPDCDTEGLLHTVPNWTFNYEAYGELTGDEAELSGFLTPSSTYHICFYAWGEQELDG